MKRIFFFDVDGTILDHKNKSVSELTKKSLVELSSNPDNILFIATGRPSFMLDCLSDIKHIFKGIISLNGAIVEVDNEVYYSNYFTEEQVIDIKNILSEEGYDYFGYYSRDYFTISYQNDEIDKSFESIGFDKPVLMKDDMKINEVSQFFFVSKTQEFNNLQFKLGSEFSIVPWFYGGADILLKGETKASSIQKIVDYFSVDKENVYCFGDGRNDVEMIELVTNSVAMGNGCEEVKSIASFVTKSVEEEGITFALKHFGLIND